MHFHHDNNCYNHNIDDSPLLVSTASDCDDDFCNIIKHKLQNDGAACTITDTSKTRIVFSCRKYNFRWVRNIVAVLLFVVLMINITPQVSFSSVVAAFQQQRQRQLTDPYRRHVYDWYNFHYNTPTQLASVSTTDNTAVSSNMKKQKKKRTKRIGDTIYSNVQWIGQKLTFQSFNPRNSEYFFGPNKSRTQHYYEDDDNDEEDEDEIKSNNNADMSKLMFQLADDIGKKNYRKKREPVKASPNSIPKTPQKIASTLIVPDIGNKRITSSITQWKLQQQQQQVNNDEEIYVFDKDNFKQNPMEEERQVWEALASLEKDMSLLDRMIATKPQLSNFQLLLLGSAVLSTATSPLILAGQLTEFVAPSMAAFTAAIGIAAEYRGRVAVADSKEIAAATLQCAAEAEGYLASAERAKAITPLCVGIGATAATLSLLVPVLLDSILFIGTTNMQLSTEIYLFCPLVAVLSSAVAGLAVQEVKSYCDTAIGIGNRRFARSGIVSRTWLSSTELIAKRSRSSVLKWRTFSFSVLPAPILGALCPGALPTKTIVIAALAAAGSAYYLARAEYIVARASDAVALKSRSAAVCDTYANQGSRSAAILPFTSALSSLCAAATAAVVELPFVESLTGRFGTTGTMLEIVTITIFPALSALFAAAASVSKARCEVDAEAAMQAASTLALPYNDVDDKDPIIRPLKAVRELIRLTLTNSIQEPIRRFFRRFDFRRRWRYIQDTMVRWQGG